MMPSASVASKVRVTPEAAMREKIRREKARRNFLDFCQYVDPKFKPYPHIKPITEGLQKVAQFIESDGETGISRLMIMMPPRHGKTEMASIKFPAWILGRKTEIETIMASYAADLASSNSRKVRNLVMSMPYQALFGSLSSKEEPVLLSSDSRSVAKWDLAAPHSGGMVASGVGGGITGKGAHLIILDDLFKNREEGESEARRDLVDDWYRSSVLTRMEPNAAIVLFFTRWHPDDLVGRLLQRMVEDPMADQWEIICLPALAYSDYPEDKGKQQQKMKEGVFQPLSDPLGRKAGEALWPEKYSKEWLEAKKVNTSNYEFEALYQQQPYLRNGGLFQHDWFKIVPNGPGKKAVNRVMYWDKAASTKKGADYSAGGLASEDKEGFIYVELVTRGHWTPFEREEKITKLGKELYGTYGRFPIWHQQDPAAAGKESAELTNGRLYKAGLYGKSESVTERMNEIYIEDLSTAAQAGKIRLVQGGWNEPFLDELIAYPGTHDDQAVVVAGAVAKLRIKKKESRIL